MAMDVAVCDYACGYTNARVRNYSGVFYPLSRRMQEHPCQYHLSPPKTAWAHCASYGLEVPFGMRVVKQMCFLAAVKDFDMLVTSGAVRQSVAWRYFRFRQI